MSLSVQMTVRSSTLVMRLNGDLDQASSENLKRRVVDIIDKYYIRNLIINLENVPFMDSSGIGFLIGRYTQIKNRRGKIIVCSMNEMIERIFNLSGLKRICHVARNEDEATKYLEGA